MIWPLIGLAIFFPLFWLAVVWLISRLTGWSRLAEVFAAARPPTGEVFSWVSGRFGFGSNYSNCLTVTVSHHGIHIQPFLPFRLSHRPLFIPWAAVREMQQDRFFFNHRTSLKADARGRMISFSLVGRSGRLSDSLARHAPPAIEPRGDAAPPPERTAATTPDR